MLNQALDNVFLPAGYRRNPPSGQLLANLAPLNPASTTAFVGTDCATSQLRATSGLAGSPLIQNRFCRDISLAGQRQLLDTLRFTPGVMESNNLTMVFGFSIGKVWMSRETQPPVWLNREFHLARADVTELFH